MANLATAFALIAALATCDSAWCIEDAVEPARAAMHAVEEHAAAIEALIRVVGILRRSAGLYDERQYSLLSQLADLHSVRADGRIDGERVIAREPGKSATDEALQALQAARYRPRVVDGAALNAVGGRFRQAFR